MRKTADILECCPICEYSLRGLPDPHRCPECGFEYDRAMQVIRQSAKLSALEFAWVSVFLFFVALAVAAGRNLSLWQYLKLGLFAVVAISAWRVIRGRRNKAILWLGGMVLVGRESGPERFSWKQVESINYRRFGGAAQLIASGGTTITDIEQDFFGSNAKTLAFIRAAKEWRAQYEDAFARQRSRGDSSQADKETPASR